MPRTQKRSTELFKELVEALVDEGMDSGEVDIDSMRYAQMEMMGHLLGEDLSRQVQTVLAARQGGRMPETFACPRCGRDAPAETKPKPITSLDGEVTLPETRCFCKKCRKSFFPAT